MFQRTKNINIVPGSSLISGWIAMAPSTNSSLSATTDSLEAQASDLQNPLFTFNFFPQSTKALCYAKLARVDVGNVEKG